MERRYLVIRSADVKDNNFFSNINHQFIDLLKTCSSEEIVSVDGSVIEPVSGASFSLPPNCSWQTSSEVSADLNDVYSHSSDSLGDLASSVHECLDSLPTPGTFVLALLWVCDAPPSSPAPQLYGALQRARAWHGASLTLVTQTQATPPGWLASLRAEVVSEADLDEDLGLKEFLSPYLAWRGSLAFQVDPLNKVKLPGFELHLDQDDIQTTIQRVNPQPRKARMTKKYFSPELEVVTTVPVSSVLAQPQYLTGQRVELKVPVLDHDELSENFMAELGDSGFGYILKLKYSSDKGEYDMNLLKTEHWKQCVINCNFSLDCPCPVLGVDVSSVNILVLDDPREDSDCARATLKKYGVVMKNTCDVNKLYSFQQSLSQSTFNIKDMEEVVTGISQFNFDDNFLKLKSYVRRVQAKVLLTLKESNSDLLVNERVEDILVSVQEEILNRYEALVDKRKIDKSDTDKVITAMQKVVDIDNKRANSSEDWQELRFLNYLATISEKEEEERAAQSKLLKPSEEEFVVLEAKELIKYFDVNGLPTKSLEEVEIKKKVCPLRPQKSSDDYISMRDKHFTEIANTDFSFKGFRFNEDKDFSTIEFTQFHDVYYNTGNVAEDFDTECKNYRDCMVGPHRETMSTFTTGDNTRVKLVTRRPSEKLDRKERIVRQERRVSPRKKPVLPNVTDKNMQVRKSQKSRLDTSKNSDKGDARRKSGGDPPAPGELSEIHKKKLRIAVYDALHRSKVDEKNPLFKKCFPKLFQICKMYVLEGFDE